jgi:tetratricopeptide (TPR) repeat protein
MNGYPGSSSQVQKLLETERRVGRTGTGDMLRRALTSVSPAEALPTAELLSLAHHYRAAISLVERNRNAWRQSHQEQFRAAVIYYVCRQPQKAIELLEELRRVRPNDPGVLTELAVAYVSIGAIDTAKALLRAAAHAEPRWIPALHELSLLSKFAPDDQTFVSLKDALKDESRLPRSWAIRLHYALGKSYDDLGDHASAWNAFASGARLAFKSQEDSARLAHLQAEEISRSAPPLPSEPAAKILFVVGMPRSGTTLVEQVLLGAEDSSSIGESPALECAIRLWLQKSEADPRARWGDQSLRILTGEYDLFWPEYDEGRASILVDKTPGNYLWAAPVTRAFPGARIVHCKRDPLEVCWSLYTTWFGVGTAWSYDLKSIANAYKRYHNFTADWTARLGSALIEVQHQDLASDPVASSQALFRDAGLRWNPTAIETHERSRPVVTPSMGQVRRKIGDVSLRRHKVYLPYLEPLVDALAEAGIAVQ